MPLLLQAIATWSFKVQRYCIPKQLLYPSPEGTDLSCKEAISLSAQNITPSGGEVLVPGACIHWHVSCWMEASFLSDFIAWRYRKGVPCMVIHRIPKKCVEGSPSRLELWWKNASFILSVTSVLSCLFVPLLVCVPQCGKPLSMTVLGTWLAPSCWSVQRADPSMKDQEQAVCYHISTACGWYELCRFAWISDRNWRRTCEVPF